MERHKHEKNPHDPPSDPKPEPPIHPDGIPAIPPDEPNP